MADVNYLLNALTRAKRQCELDFTRECVAANGDGIYYVRRYVEVSFPNDKISTASSPKDGGTYTASFPNGKIYTDPFPAASFLNGGSYTIGDVLQYQSDPAEPTTLVYQKMRYAFLWLAGSEIRLHVNIDSPIAHSPWADPIITPPTNVKFQGEPAFVCVPNRVRFIEDVTFPENYGEVANRDFYGKRTPGVSSGIIMHPNMHLVKRQNIRLTPAP